MRNTAYVTILIVGLFSCSSNNMNPIVNSQLIGEWKLTEAFISAGGPQYWVDVENGEELVFFNSGIFTSNRFSECMTGAFSIEQKQLSLEYNCNGFQAELENEDGLVTYNLEFGSDYFIATPTSGPICLEGCSYKFQRN